MDLNKKLNSNLLFNLKVCTPCVLENLLWVSQDSGDACDFKKELSPALKG